MTEKLSPEFKLKAELAKSKGLNIYALTQRFYKISKLKEQLPEEVLLGVLNKYLLTDSKLAPWPYFLTVLKSESFKYFAKKNIAEGKVFKDSPTIVGEIMRRISNQ